MTFADGRATHVDHISGLSSALPPQIYITHDFKMVSWFSDVNCLLKVDQAEYHRTQDRPPSVDLETCE